MRRFLTVLAVVVAWCSTGCRTYEEPIAREYLEDDHVSNYRRVFDISPPHDVDVLNSLVIAYSSQPRAHDDWVFEVMAPKSWIQRMARSLHLERAEAVNSAITHINERKQNPIRPWYAPRPITEYQLYYLAVTTVPYVQMLVELEEAADGRRRVFISKL